MIIIEKRRWGGAKVVLAVFVLLVLLVGGGVAYTYYWGPEGNVPDNKPKETALQPNALLQAPKTNPNAPVGMSVQVITSPVAPGENAMYVIKTKPKTLCTVAVAYGTLVSKDTGLAPKTADDYGTVSWTWTVDKAAPLGKYEFETRCTDQKTGKWGRVIGEQTVAKTSAVPADIDGAVDEQ